MVGKAGRMIVKGLAVVAAILISIVLGFVVLFARLTPGLAIAVRLIPLPATGDFEQGTWRIVIGVLINAACWFILICGVYILGVKIWHHETK
jgi:hypothetical protein